jgi:NDP-sugar pyrophosphorylase family protein
MQIIIPMSGEGSRFRSVGYQDLKPMIPVFDNRRIIEFVISLFPGEYDFLFICRQAHLDNTDMAQVLGQLMPTGRVIGIEGAKKGPVWAVTQAFDHIDDTKPCIVNYCDFYMRWDYQDFKQSMETSRADGGIPCYKGFHPHLLHPNNYYASCLVDQDNWMIEIREKYSFTADKTQSPQSGGTYYMRTGAILKKYYQQMLDQDINLNGEYYSSLVYNLMQADGLRTLIYDRVSHFCQWGTPEDFEEYQYWQRIFTDYAKQFAPNSIQPATQSLA